jgi:quinol monooxygenase YgiN
MIRRVAEYTIRDGELEPILVAIACFAAAVRAGEPETRYEAYRREDTLSFLHIMAFRDETAEHAHRRAPYTTEFVEALYPRCVEEPRFTGLRPIEPPSS